MVSVALRMASLRPLAPTPRTPPLSQELCAPTNIFNNRQRTGSLPALSPLLERSVLSTFTQGRTWTRGCPTMLRVTLGHRGVPKT